jgi:hypothetical protein
MVKPKIYDAYTGISLFKKNTIVQFLLKNLASARLEGSVILKAIESATKEIPSFGGFVITVEEENEIIAALVVNKTGLGGILPEYIAVFQATKPVAKAKIIARKLEEKAIVLSQGDISLLSKSNSAKTITLKKMNPNAKFRPIQTKNKDKRVKKASA